VRARLRQTSTDAPARSDHPTVPTGTSASPREQARHPALLQQGVEQSRSRGGASQSRSGAFRASTCTTHLAMTPSQKVAITRDFYGHGWARTTGLSRVKRYRTPRVVPENTCKRADNGRRHRCLKFCQFALKSAGFKPVATSKGLMVFRASRTIRRSLRGLDRRVSVR